ncbi:MAG: type II 3-dehydroquinate dehydratase [Leptospiraceae bacterium]|nr:type II 3-dehydroquinate dehydratase [Leptospiraceae bacterium]MDW7974961.1 type II 3-dehydroquinate dehydratase [Leptospiraceae bacterium]
MKEIKILLLNGPNLNLLGYREPHIYGNTTLKEIEEQLEKDASLWGAALDCFQSNYEGALIEKIQEYYQKPYDGIIINPGGLTHTSVSLRDALLSVNVPFVEIHISNVYAREPFRHHSFLSDKALFVISGMGIFGYRVALLGLIQKLKGLSWQMDLESKQLKTQ